MMVLCFFLLANSCLRPTRSPRQPAQGEPRFIVMTYNVNFGLAGDSSILETIRKSQADVVFLQETTLDWEAAIRAALSELYPHMGFRGGSGAGGLAVLVAFTNRFLIR